MPFNWKGWGIVTSGILMLRKRVNIAKVDGYNDKGLFATLVYGQHLVTSNSGAFPPVCDRHGSLWLHWWYWHQFYILNNRCPSGSLKLARGCRGSTFRKISCPSASLHWLAAFPTGGTVLMPDITGRGPLISPRLCSWCSPVADSTWCSFNIMNYGRDFGHMLSLIRHLDKSLKVAVLCTSLPQSPAAVPRGLRTQKEG